MSGPNTSYDPVRVAALEPSALEAAVAAGVAAFAAAADLEVLALARAAHLVGNDAPVRLAQREIGALPPAAKGEAGQRVNTARAALQSAYDVRLAVLEADRDARVLLEQSVDVTLPVGEDRPVGARHPLTLIQEQVADVFLAMGWEVAEGPEVEAAWFNFDALAIGPDHSSRSDMDTIYVADGSGSATTSVVLRTHTSNVQIRTMLSRELPIAICCPGRVYRADTMDATHLPVFSQVEGLLVDEGVTMAHLKGTLDHLAEAMFGPGTVTRLRPSYFPFVEPGAEVDYRCHTCHGALAVDGERCPTCRGEGWIEWGGCGMVAPAVLRSCGITPTEDGGPWSGFAFGMGLERTVMARHGVSDIRDLVEGDVRLTVAFGSD